MEIRGNDRHGSGAYRASRGGRLHNGIDICCNAGDPVGAVSGGLVTKIGYPYSQASGANQDKAALRYVEVTDANNIRARYFYVNPLVQVGERVGADAILGEAQGLAHIYPEITEHFHFEALVLVNGRKVFCDPEQYLDAFGGM